MRIIQLIKKALPFITPALVAGAGGGVTSCARMGAPDGGWFDERPPKVISSTPGDRETGVTKKKVTIYFDEFVKLENATEKVVVSPPQIEMPEIKAQGKKISVNLLDSLKPNTTYTIDFSDAISDNNEGNPMGHYTYSFSTGSQIDTLEVSGTVLEAQTLEPIKGILVGLIGNPTPCPRPEAEVEYGVDSLESAYSLSNNSKFSSGNVTPASGRGQGVGSPFIRVSRTDSRGTFVIRGIAPGDYTVGALKDMDGDFCFSQSAETMAFSHETITPRCFEDMRQDTIWQDELHVKDILRVKYNHFVPDNIILRAFDHEQTDRFFLKSERKSPESFTLFYTAPLDTPQVSMLPEIRLLNATPSPYGEGRGGASPFVIEPSHRGDTITYWLRDTALVNMDTLRIEVKTLLTDTLGVLQASTDTLEILSKIPYAKRMKDKQKEDEEWQKKVEKQKKKYDKAVAVRLKEGLKPGDPEYEEGLPKVDSIRPVERLKPNYKVDGNMSPDGTVYINFPVPLNRIDTAAVHLYVEQDSLWYRAPFTFEPVKGEHRKWQLYTDWIMEAQYSLEIDTLAFEDIYGKTSEPYKTGIQVKSLTEFSSLFVNFTVPDYAFVSHIAQNTAAAGTIAHDSIATDSTAVAPMPMTQQPKVIIELLDGGDKVKRSISVPVDPSKGQMSGTAEFYYLEPGSYYMKAIIDSNGNGKWDTGDYYLDRQPEYVFYYNEEVECKAKWDITKTWNLTYRPLNQQKPSALIKQKADKEKEIKNRNAERAQQKGIEIPERFRQ